MALRARARGPPPPLAPLAACFSATLYSTQEDPIGLAGGLNLYGYAGGDPVNSGDPFGLSGCPKDSNDPDCSETVEQAAMRAANEWFNRAAARVISIAGAVGNYLLREGPSLVAEETAMAFVPLVGEAVAGRRIARVVEGGARFLSENRHLRSAAHAWEASGLTPDEVLDAIDATSGWQTATQSILRQRTVVKGIEIEFNVFRQSAGSSEWIVNAWIK